MRINITIADDDNFTEVWQEREGLTWTEAHDLFFRALRGAGYVINGEDYIAEITEAVEQLTEAERGGMTGFQQSLDVGGGGFLSGDDNV